MIEFLLSGDFSTIEPISVDASAIAPKQPVITAIIPDKTIFFTLFINIYLLDIKNLISSVGKKREISP